RPYYEEYVDLLLDLDAGSPGAGFDAEALRASERARARLLLETIAEARADAVAGIDPLLVEREQKRRQAVIDAAARRRRLLEAPKATPAVAESAQVLQEAITAHQEALDALRQASPNWAQ